MNLTKLKPHLAYGVLGVAFGVVLSRVGFGDYGELHNMFILNDLRLLYAFSGAVGLSMLAFFVLRNRIPPQQRLFQPGTLPGSMLLGFGWAVSGACPSIVLVQLGQGSLGALFTLFGMLCGIWLYRKIHARFFGWDTGSCGV